MVDRASCVTGIGGFSCLGDGGLSRSHARDFTTDTAEYRLLCEEVRISCIYGMLLCLTRPLRAAYLLGDVLGLPDTDGAAICEITPAAFRQRLSRARRTIRHVIDNRCGLVNPANPCRCGRQIQSSLDLGFLDRDQLTLAGHPRRPGDSLQHRRLNTIADQIDTAQPGQGRGVTRRHTFREVTVRRLYPGPHRLDIQVNGHVLASTEVTLTNADEQKNLGGGCRESG